MKERIVKSYVDKLTINDIKNFGYQNDIILSDNEYTQHGDMNARRYRSNELCIK